MDAEDRLVSFDQFRRRVRDAPLGLIGSSPGEQTFSLLMDRGDTGDITVNHFAGSDHTVEHLGSAEDDSDDGGLSSTRMVHVQLDGSSTLVQNGRTAVLRPGDIALYSSTRPFSLDHSGESLILRAPTTELQVQDAVIDELLAVRLDRERPMVGAVTPLARHLGRTLETGDSGVETRMVDAAIRMLGAIVLETSRETGYTARTVELDAVLHYIEENLSRPDLSVGEIAAANFMSARKLHSLFEMLDITVAAWVRSRRLHHCRRELVDSAFSGLTIAQIAARWGFKDAAHFSRSFTDRFGASPRAFRAAHSGAPLIDVSHRTRAKAVSPIPASPPAHVFA
ncbi:MAG: helix-turn-helix domain-containing protein [Actinobacteria bacterium]|nr:helix-turn-helix domain-containing protein [Actinomycetota bacterium]